MINILGIISKDGKEIEGYHVNSTEEIEGAEDYRIETPTDYKNSFFGVPVEETFFYKFTCKDECDSVLGISEDGEDVI